MKIKIEESPTFDIELPDGTTRQLDPVEVALEIESLGIGALDVGISGRKILQYWRDKLKTITLAQAYQVMLEFTAFYGEFRKKVESRITSQTSQPSTGSFPTAPASV